jgi:hypothetical protein
MTSPWAVHGGHGLNIWRVAASANVFNQQSRTGDKGWCLPAGVLGEGLTTSYHKISTCYEMLHIAFGLI